MMRLCYHVAFLSALFLLNSSGDVAAEIPSSTSTFLNKFCIDCHNADSAEAGLDLTRLNSNLEDLRTFAVWERIHDRVQKQEMPPSDATIPTASVRDEFIANLGSPLTEAHQKRKGTVLRRLNGKEYQNTLNDLFGTHLQLAEMLPPDGRSREFDNVGHALSMSMVQLRQYLSAFEVVLDTSIAKTAEAPKPKLIETSYAETSEGDRFIGDKWLKAADGAVVFFQNFGYPTGMLRTANTQKAGWYKISIEGYAYQATEPITFSVGGTTFQRGAERPTFGYFQVQPGQPQTIELTVWMEDRYMVEITPYGIYDERYEIKNNGLENYKGPGLAIKQVTLEGPLLEEFPSRGHRLLFEGINRREIPPRNPRDKEKPWYQARFEIDSSSPANDAQAALKRIAARAFRRPVNDAELEPYVQLFSSEMKNGADFEESFRTAVTAVFCSPHFLYLQERAGELNDFELASRLSYFLTRTLPDDSLLEDAEAGRLTGNPDALAQATERLLNDQRLDRFITDFTDAWLNLREIDFTTPDRTLFPEYDPFLHDSMLKETHAYFRTQIEENLPVVSNVASDFAMLNSRLAELYEIDGVSGPQIRKVSLPENSLRGGYLGQASILKVSANGTNTSPVVRGVWVLERMLGEHAPPPPPGIPGVEPDIRGASTLREILAKHRDSNTCQACHQMIDPPGFALECFNPIGAFRDRYRSIGSGDRVQQIVHGRKVNYRLGLAVDASGEMSNGNKFEDYLEFRKLLAEEEEILTRAFLTKLLTFACGRELGFSDRAELNRLVAVAVKENHGIRDLIHDVVESNIFRTK